jgi:hypothetical protein
MVAPVIVIVPYAGDVASGQHPETAFERAMYLAAQGMESATALANEAMQRQEALLAGMQGESLTPGLEEYLFQIEASGKNLGRAASQTLPIPQVLQATVDETFRCAVKKFPALNFPSAVRVELIDARQLKEERSEQAINNYGIAQWLKEIEISKHLAGTGLVERGRTVARIENGVRVYVIQVPYVGSPESVGDFGEISAHELGHVAQFHNGRIRNAYSPVFECEDKIKRAYKMACEITGITPRETPLTKDAWNTRRVDLVAKSVLLKSEPYQQLWANIHELEVLLGTREKTSPPALENFKQSLMLREGFACWFASMLGYERGDQPIEYKTGLATFKLIAASSSTEALKLGLDATRDSDLMRYVNKI